MKARFARFAPLAGAVMVCLSLTHLSPRAVSAQAEEAPAAPQVVLSETYNAVTGIYFTNIAVHKGSHKPGLVERRFRADVNRGGPRGSRSRWVASPMARPFGR